MPLRCLCDPLTNGDAKLNADKFRALCEAHDMTYSWSDDHGVWKAGMASYAEIRLAVDVLGKEVANPIWNDVVDKTICTAEDRNRFYW